MTTDFSVLEYDTCKVVTYELTKGKGQWVQQGVIQVQDIRGRNYATTLLYYNGTFIITIGKILVTTGGGNMLVKYTENNQLIKKVTCDMLPALCDTDSSGKLLVAGFYTHKFSLYNTDTMEICKDVNVEYLADIRYPRDMRIQDGKVMWVLSGRGNDFYITKYTLT